MTVPGSSQTATDSCSQGAAVTSSDSGTSQGSEVLANTIHSTESTGYVKTRYEYAAESLPFVETVHPLIRKTFPKKFRPPTSTSRPDASQLRSGFRAHAVLTECKYTLGFQSI